MILELRRLPADKVNGIYKIGGIEGRLPARALWLHPLAAESFLAELADHIVVSDMLRSAESSLRAVQTKRGAQPPGFSGHNYGFSIDIEVDEAIRATGVRTKAELDKEMATRGWHCHRTDGVAGFEAWHYNYLRLSVRLGLGELEPAGRLTSDELEQLIQRVYGAELAPSDTACQSMLAKLGLYHGDIDGDIGPLSQKATEVFQRGWGLTADGVLGPRTRRTLAFCAAERHEA